MAKPRPLTDEEGEVRGLTGADFAQFVPFAALPLELQQVLSSAGQIVPDAKPPAAEQPAA